MKPGVKWKKDVTGDWRWSVIGDNGSDVVADSGEGYKRRRDAEDGLITAFLIMADEVHRITGKRHK